MATLAQLREWQRAADATGNAEDAAGIQQRITAKDYDDISQGASAGAGAAQGLTGGFGDEIYGATHAALGKIPGGRSLLNDVLGLDSDYEPVQLTESAQGRADELGMQTPDSPYSYTGLRDRARQVNADAQAANPKTYMGAEIGSGLALGVGGGVRAAAGQTLRQAVPRLAGIGAAEGGAAGTGYSEAGTIGGVAQDAAVGAGLGAGLGAALPAAGNLAGRAAQLVSSAGRAERRILKDLADAGVTPERAQQMLDENPGMVLADLSENLQQRLGGAAQSPGTTPQKAAQQLRERNVGQQSRFGELYRQALGDTPVGDAAEAAVQRTRTKAGPLYDTAYETTIGPAGQRRLKQLLDRDPAAVSRAQKMARREGVDIDLDGPLDVRTVDYIQRALRSRASKLTNSGAKDEARAFNKLRDDFLSVVDGPPGQPSAFLQARKIAADEFSNRDALEFGAKVFTERTPNLRRTLADMGESELEHFRIGVFEQITDMMASRGEQANVARLFSTPKRTEAIRLAFGNDELFNTFKRQLGNEDVMFETMRKALQGSPTTSRQAFGASTVPQSMYQATAQGVQKSFNALAAGPQRRANDIVGDALLGRNPQRMLQDMAQPQPLGRTTGALAAPIGIDPQKQLDLLLGR